MDDNIKKLGAPKILKNAKTRNFICDEQTEEKIFKIIKKYNFTDSRGNISKVIRLCVKEFEVK